MKTNEKPKLGRPFLHESERKKSVTMWISQDALSAVDKLDGKRSANINRLIISALKNEDLL